MLSICQLLAKNSNQIIILEEGNKTRGWGSEMCALISDKYLKSMISPIIRTASEDHPIPCAMSLESKTLPSVEKLSKIILKNKSEALC